ncbi:biotin transport system ATP-binding protein [Mycetocola sp. BIGb0189]|uniref:energy-coupling factor ABC transporter ATP-binding protein n=1 Tax=Mycetocola sp. BIGb0189 TaxID=2940604 RepID=UPI002166F457|nr:ABC transporter ATP-binding protein [Mycetocola sp. BIGb0189]MCS4276632.1 biotin transport system ATP-binding protein [Mycetocola sp. BIGb0189]
MAGTITFDRVGVRFGDYDALRDVTITLTQARIGIIGLNGSGKSTFARMLNALVLPGAGEVRVHGIDPSAEAARVRQIAGFVFANPDAQIIMPTVAEDVAFSLRGRGVPRAEIAARVTAELEVFGLSALADAPAHELSGGQKQLLALCAVLITRPDLVIADEPTALLDARNRRLIIDHLFSERVPQLVLVTHDLDLAARCDVVLRFEDGRLLEHGDPAEVIARYREAYA